MPAVDPFGPVDATAAADPSVAIMRAAAEKRARDLQEFQQQQQLRAAQEARTQASAALAQTHDQHIVQQDQQAATGRTMANDLATWTQNPATPQYRVPWDQAPEEVRAHVATAYPDNAASAPKAWNEGYTANTGNVVTPRVPATSAQKIAAQKAGIAIDPNDSADDIVAKMATKQAQPAVLNDEQQKLAEAIANYDIPPAQALSRFDQATREKVMAHAANLGYDAKEYPTRVASRRDFTSGKAAQSITSLNTVIHHLGNALESNAKMDNTRAPFLNAPLNAVRRGLGNADVTSYETNANAVAEEMAKLLKGGVATKSEIDEWKASLSPNLGPKQLQDNIAEMIRLIAGRVDGLRNQWQSAYSRPRELPFLDKDAQAILRKHGFDPGAIDPSTANPGAETLPPAVNVPAANEPTATNPKTGQKVVFRNGQWQPL